jgi:metal-responsive CopG/Arc/MetJ family transcriptional regulator
MDVLFRWRYIMPDKVKVTISLPKELADSLRKDIPDRNRSKFIAKTIEKELKEMKKKNLIKAYQSAYQEISDENEAFEGVTGDGLS